LIFTIDMHCVTWQVGQSGEIQNAKAAPVLQDAAQKLQKKGKNEVSWRKLLSKKSSGETLKIIKPCT
jgi:hypothetical protein